MLRTGTKQSQIAFRNGCTNIGYFAGVVANLSESSRSLVIHRDNNANHGVEFFLGEKGHFPRDVREGNMTKTTYRLLGYQREDGLWSLRPQSIGFAAPDFVDIPPAKNFRQILKPGVPAFQFGVENAEPDEALDRIAVPIGPGNTCSVAGWISGARLAPTELREDGSKKLPEIEVLIRQTEDADDQIPVLVRGPKAVSYSQMLKTGMPAFASGKLFTIIKSTGAQMPDGSDEVVKRHVLMADTLSPADGQHLQATPEWALNLWRSHDRKAAAAQRQPETAPGLALDPALLSAALARSAATPG